MAEKSVKNLKYYVKDVSFESPASPGIFQSNFQPQIEVRVEVKNRALPDSMYEVSLEITAEAKDAEQKPMFIVEVEQAGLFEVKGFEQNELNHILGAFCPTQIFPFVRQTVDSLMVGGGFPPLMLAPMNFEQLHAQRNQQQ